MPVLVTITDEGKLALQQAWAGEKVLSPLEASLLSSTFKATDWLDLALIVRKTNPLGGYKELGRTAEALRSLEQRGYIEQV